MDKYSTIREIWQILFNIVLTEDEYVEVAYDSGDKNFNKARHFKSPDELIEFIDEHDGLVNMAISPNTRLIPEVLKLNKRSGQSACFRQRIVVLDVENPEKHTKISEKEAIALINEALREMPDDIRSSVILIGYTGGGGQIWLKANRWMEKGEIAEVYRYLKKRLEHIRWIDTKSFNFAQAQRLLGSLNVKYDPPIRTKILKVREVSDENCINVDLILKIAEAERIELERQEEEQKYETKITNLRDAIREIKKRLRFEDIDSFTRERVGSGYTAVSCPFHPPDNNPSFVIVTHAEGYEIAFDNHDGCIYDIIEYYRKRYDKDFITAVRELAQKAGVKLAFTKEAKRELEREEKLKEFDPDQWLAELGVKEVKLFKTLEGEYVYSFSAEDRNGEIVSFKVNAQDFEKKTFLKKWRGATGKLVAPELPQKLEKEAWKLVTQRITQVAEEDMKLVELEDMIQELYEILLRYQKTWDIGEFRDGIGLSLWLPSFQETNVIYIHPYRLHQILQKHELFKCKGLEDTLKWLRTLGAKPVRKRVGRQVRLSLWELSGQPLEKLLSYKEDVESESELNDLNNFLTKPVHPLSTHQSLERQGNEEGVDTQSKQPVHPLSTFKALKDKDLSEGGQADNVFSQKNFMCEEKTEEEKFQNSLTTCPPHTQDIDTQSLEGWTGGGQPTALEPDHLSTPEHKGEDDDDIDDIDLVEFLNF